MTRSILSTEEPRLALTQKAKDVPTSSLKHKNRTARRACEKQTSTAISFIQTTKFCPPVIVDENNNVLSGEVWLTAARHLNLEMIPVVCVSKLTAAQKIAVEIGYVQILGMSGWDADALKEKFEAIYEVVPEFNFESIGFSSQETDLILFPTNIVLDEDDCPDIENAKAVSEVGDIWFLGDNRLYNGSATDKESYLRLIGELMVRMIFTDPPYNVKTQGHIGGSGKTKHREFLQAAGEMSADEFTNFLTDFVTNAYEYLLDGAVLYICMDFRHMMEVLKSAEKANLIMLNLCVWCKNNGGMGSYYRSQHELVFVFRKGKTSHINNIELGKHGRYRTNVWNYDGVNTFKTGRMDELGMHPTVKPVAMVSDAILDSSKRGEYILDPFAGSGTIFIACEKTGRKGLGIELDPLYVDVAIRRWEQLTGRDAIHKETGETFKAREKRVNERPLLALPAPRPRHRGTRKGGENV